MKRTGLVLATIASAILYGLAFAPHAFRPLAWVAAVPLLAVLQRARFGEALLLAWLWSLAMSQIVADWLPGAVARYYDQPIGVGVGVALLAETLQVGVHYMAFAALHRGSGTASHVLRPVFVGAAWAAAEFSRVQLLWGNPLAVLGYSQVGFIPLMQIADVTGVYGVSFLVMTANAALFEIALAARAPERRRAALGGVAIAAALVILAFGYARLRIQSLGSDRGERRATVAVVQGAIDLGSQWKTEFYGRNLDTYLDLTATALRANGARLVVWPENTLTFFLEEEPEYRSTIAQTLAPYHAQILTGGPRYQDPHDPLYFNSAFLLSDEGTILARYDKELLLPLAEYFPFSSIDFLHRRFGRIRVFTPGPPTPPLPTVAGMAGVLICNEAMFPQPAAARARAGASFLVNLANDTWLGDEEWGPLVFDIVTMRAVEQRRYLVRASTSGPSAIIDPRGEVQVFAPPGARTTIAGEVRSATGVTIYGRCGDAFAWACVAAALIGAPLLRRRARSRVVLARPRVRDATHEKPDHRTGE
jgi:apolipoprotein N-acyltransferase